MLDLDEQNRSGLVKTKYGNNLCHTCLNHTIDEGAEGSYARAGTIKAQREILGVPLSKIKTIGHRQRSPIDSLINTT